MRNALATDIGHLYIVATPIGNREDISLRAIHVLKTVDLIIAEDTRHSLQLLNALGIKNKLSSLHAHNENNKSDEIIQNLLNGKRIALISDAGTPLISDPGYPLVKLAHQHAIPVSPIPGPCALIAALSGAGVPSDVFTFCGFLPAKQHARREKLSSLLPVYHTLIFYESTHRILESIEDIGSIFGVNCPLVLVKELTKTFEQFQSGTVEQVKDWLINDPDRVKGEFVLIIPPRIEQKEDQSMTNLLTILLNELPLKQAVSIACKISNGNKNEIYQTALALKDR
ncbi:16S rRNA (cytidine(1402)-2'-O)-methyltransferase [Legionella waltersii]|uniref:Ribosomal RNA small subunit methyltransferase I n=1 Tax=Legionella waltersii TaxID=66969 RepID=A0A0W1A551_9GAMM|nr:16S rRNA (cytidine(1402)-2'-O)-methyltransferase [Legionella waltersii]KTD76481.1 methyltransferase [Legionella waltersii]SNV14701.1 methyltransferase [Legionella waltersii]